MKKNYIFCAVIGVILASTVYYFNGVLVMLSVLLIYMMLSRIILKQRAAILRQRSEWKANPIPPKLELFEAFFWHQLISQQNWYLDNIYSMQDIKSLINQYKTAIATVWCEQASSYEEKLRTSRKLERHLNLLTYALEYKRISENA
ncbi:MAG: hypothetical protein MR368_02975 [Azospirillum sp.]|nr:hypothetical protein [Azospirillum sp.]